jgi:hypothetical protein
LLAPSSHELCVADKIDTLMHHHLALGIEDSAGLAAIVQSPSRT